MPKIKIPVEKQTLNENKKLLKIAIVGTAQSSVQEAPYKDTSWDIWSLGRNRVVIPRYNVWFELHKEDVLQAADIEDDHYEFLKRAGDNLVLGWPDDKYPNAKLYPLDEILSMFNRKYFTSSIAYMIALAIYLNADEIALYGVDMLASEEYADQRPCCEYLLGIAEGKGIKVTIAKDSPLLRADRLYAFESVGISREILLRQKEYRHALEQSRQEVMRGEYLRGRLDEINEIAKRWG